MQKAKANRGYFYRMSMAAAVLVLVTSLLVVSAARSAQASSPFVVNSAGDQQDANTADGVCLTLSGASCTLRAAIQQANANPGADTINFNHPNSFAFIQPQSPLPQITEQTTIDGYTQPGSSPNTLAQGDNAAIRVQLDGRSAGNTSGLIFNEASNSIVQGLAINNFSRDGIAVVGGLGVRIRGNFIGTDEFGTSDQGNGEHGVDLRSSFASAGGAHFVGGDSPASRNVISGNGRDGVSISESSSNVVQGNYIGTDKDGTDALTNDDMGNDDLGVGIDQSANNTIGGPAAGQGNVISNSDSVGVFIGRSTGNVVLGNRIGTDRTGKKDLGNLFVGLEISGSSNTEIGNGTAEGSNTIAFSGHEGVDVTEGGGAVPGNTNANTVSGNSIFSNAGLAINLRGGLEDFLGRTANDTGDVDIGPNSLQNKPVLTSAKTVSGKTIIKGRLNSAGNVPYIVQFYSNPRGTNEGAKFIGQKIVSTDASGDATFRFKPSKKVAAGRTITATATRDFFNVPTDTSEFSAAKKVISS
jgi:CSLREA domain-containing protein